MNETRRRGRPLDRDCDQRILETAVDLLSEAGFNRFRMQDVAERAGVGFGTIYRRWRTKDSLIVAALKSAVADVDDENTGDLDGFRRQLRDVAAVVDTKQGDLIPGLIAALHRDRDLAETFRASWSEPRMAGLQAAVRAAAPGPINDNLARMLAETGLGVLLYRVLLTDEPVTGDVIDNIVDDLVAPLLAAHAGQDSMDPRSPTERPPTANGRTKS